MTRQLPIGRVVAIVEAAIERIIKTTERWEQLEKQADPEWSDRQQARQAKDAAEREFGWQWKNVARILGELKRKGVQL